MRRICHADHPLLSEHLPFVALDHNLDPAEDHNLEELWDLMMSSRSLSHESTGVRVLVRGFTYTTIPNSEHE